MPRNPRIFIEDVPQHVIQRGNNRQACFFTAKDANVYLRILQEVLRAEGCDLHAYVLMSNHVHLLMTGTTENSVPRMMQNLGRRYVRYFNNEYGRTGTLWEGRYKSCLVADPRYVLTCYRYIELNPVRAGMCTWPGDYRWSSYRANALGEQAPWLAPQALYESLGDSPSARCKAYAELFEDGLDKEMVAILRTR